MRPWLRVSLFLPVLGGPLDGTASDWLDWSEDCQEHLTEVAPDAEFEPWASEYCPEFTAALNADPWSKSIAHDWAEYLSARDIEDLTQIARAYRAPASDWAFEAASLDEVLAALPKQQRPESLSLWDRIAQWLDDKFGGSNETDDGILVRWLEGIDIPESFWRWLGYVSIFLVLASAVAIVINELRHAGVLRRKSTNARQLDQGRTRSAMDTQDGAKQLGRTSALLEQILAHLRSANPLTFRANFTHRELLAGADELTAEQRPKLTALIETAERVTYADWTPSPGELDPVIRGGEQLLAELIGGAPR